MQTPWTSCLRGTVPCRPSRENCLRELMDSSLKANLEHLGQEKALIASGQQLVGELIQDITKKMENVSEHLQIHSSEVQDSHSAIVKDLADVRHQAQDIYQRIDHSMSEFLQYQDQTMQYCADLMRKLERMNSTLGVALLSEPYLYRGQDGSSLSSRGGALIMSSKYEESMMKYVGVTAVRSETAGSETRTKV
ncbi:protein brambleberry-like [Thalassophryne amazonica]|uniref:protein brambleberry-like n=1 Tax=Thalassophryne amazonica TaxID=390379 RepID=UPI0014725FF8|nr:protein brambleberry-like [Thalassophryne amazonica]